MPENLPQEGVLTLDLSSKVGCAYGHLSDRIPSIWSITLPVTGGEGARYCQFENALAAVMEQLAPSRMILEGHLPLPALNNVSSARQQFGLRAIAYSEAYRAMCQISEIDAPTVRMELMGRAYFPKGKVKHEVVGYCRRRGLKVTDDNQADAAMVWWWYQGQLRGTRPVPGILFQERVN